MLKLTQSLGQPCEFYLDRRRIHSITDEPERKTNRSAVGVRIHRHTDSRGYTVRACWQEQLLSLASGGVDSCLQSLCVIAMVIANTPTQPLPLALRPQAAAPPGGTATDDAVAGAGRLLAVVAGMGGERQSRRSTWAVDPGVDAPPSFAPAPG